MRHADSITLVVVREPLEAAAKTTGNPFTVATEPVAETIEDGASHD